MDKIHEFAITLLEKFKNSNTTHEELLGLYSLEDLEKLGFNDPNKEKFVNVYGKASNYADELLRVLNGINDPYLLGSGIFSRWKYFKIHSENPEYILKEPNKYWFLIALDRLRIISSGITISEVDKNLRKEIERLRKELSEALFEYDELKFQICPNIERTYTAEFGGLNCKVFELNTKMLECRRRMQLIQAYINRQEKIELDVIQNTLEIEFEEYEKKLNNMIESFKKAKEEEKTAEILSEEETNKVKKMYHKIVKNLHPDLNPDASQEAITLLTKAVNAFKSGDVKTLELIYEVILVGDIKETEVLDSKELEVRKEEILSKLSAIKQKIETIKVSYPYILYEYIADAEKIKENKEILQEKIESLEKAIAIYEKRIAEMVGNYV